MELNNLLKSIAQRTLKLLKKRGLIVKDEGAKHQFLNIKDTEADHILNSSISYRIALGKYQGRKALTFRTAPQKQHQKQKPFLAQFSSFSLHAGISSPAHDRKKRERVAISQGPVSVNKDSSLMSRVRSFINLKQPIRMEPLILSSALLTSLGLV